MSNRVASFPDRGGAPLLRRHYGRITAYDELCVDPLGDDYTLDGNGTVTRLPPLDGGTTVWLRCTGTPTFTHSAKLICPNAVPLVCAAGDLVIARADGDGIWRLYLIPLTSVSYGAAQTLTAAQRAVVRTNVSAALSGQIYGLATSNSSDAVNDIDIASGEAASTETNPVLMVLAGLVTKRLDAAWAVGTNQGGLDAGSIADYDATSTTSLTVGTGAKTFTTQAGKAFTAGATFRASSHATPANFMQGTVTSYSGTTLIVNVLWIGGAGTLTDWDISQRVALHLHLIQRSDTGVVDACFSLSSTSPTTGGNIPAAYDRKRRIRSIVREIGTIKGYWDYGDYVKWASAAFDFVGTTALADGLFNLCVPSGIVVTPMLEANLQMNAAGNCIWLVADGNASASAHAVVRGINANEYMIGNTQNYVTNTAGQIWANLFIGSGSLNAAQLKTHGFIDRR